jgi:hypothetical protein
LTFFLKKAMITRITSFYYLALQYFFSILTVSYLYQSELRRPIEKTIEVFININALNVAMFFKLRLIFIKKILVINFFLVLV